MITYSLMTRDTVLMAVLFGFLIGYMKKNEMLSMFRGRKLNLLLLIFTSLMAGWGHHFLYLFINEHVFPLPSGLDAVPRWYSCWMALLVFSLDNLPDIAGRMNHRILVVLGKYSLGVYCFHNLFIWSLGVRIVYWAENQAEVLWHTFGLWAALAVVLVCTIIMARIYEKWIGIRVNKLIRKI